MWASESPRNRRRPSPPCSAISQTWLAHPRTLWTSLCSASLSGFLELATEVDQVTIALLPVAQKLEFVGELIHDGVDRGDDDLVHVLDLVPPGGSGNLGDA